MTQQYIMGAYIPEQWLRWFLLLRWRVLYDQLVYNAGAHVTAQFADVVLAIKMFNKSEVKEMQRESIVDKLKANQSLLWLPALSWLFLYVWGLVLTNWALVPWDTAVQLPALETWHGRFNYFFDSWPGSHLLSFVVVGLSVSLFLLQVNRREETACASLATTFALTNFLFVLLAFPMLLMVTAVRDYWLDPQVSLGYQRTWPYMLTSALMIGVLLLAQGSSFLTRWVWRGPNTP